MPENNFCDFLFDFYELAQANGFLAEGLDETIAWFDVYFRPAKELGGFFIAAGIESVCEKLSQLHFSEEELAFQQKKGLDEAFIDYLRNLAFRAISGQYPKEHRCLQMSRWSESAAPLFRHRCLKRFCF